MIKVNNIQVPKEGIHVPLILDGPTNGIKIGPESITQLTIVVTNKTVFHDLTREWRLKLICRAYAILWKSSGAASTINGSGHINPSEALISFVPSSTKHPFHYLPP